MADPDRQELVAVNRLQQHDRLLADHVEAHAIDDHLLHDIPPTGETQSIGARRAPGPASRPVGAELASVAHPEAPELVAEEVKRCRGRHGKRLGGHLRHPGLLDQQRQ